MIAEQKTQVEKLAALATAKSMQIAEHKFAMRRWREQILRKTPTLVWFFAAGALLGVARSNSSGGEDRNEPRRESAKSGSIKSALGLVNASFLTWRYLNKPLSPDPEE